MSTTVLVVGTGNIGGEVMKQLAARGGVKVLGASFDPKDQPDVLLDICDVASVKKLNEAIPDGVDHVVVCCGASIFGPVSSFDSAKWVQGIENKLVSVSRLAVMLTNGEEVKILRPGGSVTVTAGQASRTINKMWPGIAANNAGLEAFVKCGGVDAPRGCRINAVSPAMIRETAVKAGLPLEGTIPVVEAAAHYIPLVFGDMTAQVVDAGAQEIFTRSHHAGMKDQHESKPVSTP